MLQNPGFEQPWGTEDGGDSSHRCLIFAPDGTFLREEDIGNIHTPSGGWVTWFVHDHRPNPGDGWDQPEVRDAWVHHDPRRAHSGQKGTLLFTYYCRHDAGFLQQVQVTPGTTLRLSAWAHAWSCHIDTGHNDDAWWSEGVGYAPHERRGEREFDGAQNYYVEGETQDGSICNFTFWVGIDPTGGTNPLADTVVWGQGAHVYNEYHPDPLPSVEVEAQAETVTVFLRSRTLWPFEHNDAYWDDAELTVVPDQPQPPVAEFAVICDDLACTFDGLASYDPDGYIVEYDWDFGDGECAIGWATIGHAYTEAGTYSVTLTVTDDDGLTGSVTHDVTVHDELPPPPGECRLPVIVPYLESVNISLVEAMDGMAKAATAVAKIVIAIDDMIDAIEEEPLQNLPPIVDAGPDQTITLPASATLAGTVTDDGLPDLPGVVAVEWSKVSGTGDVVFGDENAEDTTASFSAAGVYVLRLTADDWELTTSDDVTVTVEDVPAPPPLYDTRVGIHAQADVVGIPEYYNATQCAMFKAFWLQAYGRVGGSPDTFFVFRQFVDHQGQYLWHPGGIEAGVRAFIDTFRDSLVTEAGKSSRPIFAESLNEEYSHDLAQVERSILFDGEFVRQMAALHPNVRAVVFNGPVGNPDESQYALLVPLAEIVMQYDGAFGLHSYWGANRNHTYLESWWPWLAGRFTEIDKVLNANGIHNMRWLMGEGGAVGAYTYADLSPVRKATVSLLMAARNHSQQIPATAVERMARHAFGGRRFRIVTRPTAAAHADDADASENIILLPDSGWKDEDCYNGDWLRYRSDIELYQSLIRPYNAAMTLFTTATKPMGWWSFQIDRAEMESLAQVL